MSSFSPPASQLTPARLAFLQSVDSPTIANAVEPFGLRELSDGYIGGSIRSMFPTMGVMVGQALTVKVSNPVGPQTGREGYWAMWEALATMPKPSVIVMQDISGAPTRCAYAGEVMSTLAQRLGAVGMVTDGGYRDLHEVEALGFHYFAPYAVVSHGNFAIQEVGEPVVIDGQRIRTGDVLHGDANGIVVVPEACLDDLPAKVEAIRSKERAIMDFIKSETFDLEKMKAGTGY